MKTVLIVDDSATMRRSIQMSLELSGLRVVAAQDGQQALELKDNPAREPFTISGNGKQVRDVLHVDDAVQLYASCIELGDKLRGNAYNIGGGMDNSLSLLELFGILEQELGIGMTYRQLPPRESDQKVFVADIGKIHGLTGWKPQVDKKTGVLKMLAWLQSPHKHA